MPTRDADTRQYTVRKPKPAPSKAKPAKPGRPSAAGATATARRGRAGKLPGWGELARKGEAAPAAVRGQAYFETISTLKFALLLLAVAAAFTLYVGHVHATQDLLAEVQQLRKDNERLHMRYNRLKGEFDRRVGPAVIYERARALGLEEDIRFGPTLEVE